MTDNERKGIAELILSYLDHRLSEYEWDDFLSIEFEDQEYETIRLRCADLCDEYPPRDQSEYCGPEGIEKLRQLAQQMMRPAKTSH